MTGLHHIRRNKTRNNSERKNGCTSPPPLCMPAHMHHKNSRYDIVTLHDVPHFLLILFQVLFHIFSCVLFLFYSFHLFIFSIFVPPFLFLLVSPSQRSFLLILSNFVSLRLLPPLAGSIYVVTPLLHTLCILPGFSALVWPSIMNENLAVIILTLSGPCIPSFLANVGCVTSPPQILQPLLLIFVSFVPSLHLSISWSVFLKIVSPDVFWSIVPASSPFLVSRLFSCLALC